MTCEEIYAAQTAVEAEIDQVAIILEQANTSMVALQELYAELLILAEGCSSGMAVEFEKTQSVDRLKFIANHHAARLKATAKQIEEVK